MKSFISVWKEEIVMKNGINLLITLILIFFKLEKSKSLLNFQCYFKFPVTTLLISLQL